ncbi:hypothetical protein RI367_005358 [Sorochytrium milnesiophthora]
MFCSLSGEACVTPVVAKSGYVYEKRLIEKHLEENGTDPVTGDSLSEDDLVLVKSAPDAPSSKFVSPRLTSHTSIPSLLLTFQNEWDALMLETHAVKSQNMQLRQELSRALYQHDASCRVIARLLKENDELKEQAKHARVQAPAPAVNNNNNNNGNDMQVDEPPAQSSALPAEVLADMEATAASLSGTRRKRKAPPTLVPKTAFTENHFAVNAEATLSHGASNAAAGINVVRLVVTDGGETFVATGGNDKNVSVFNRQDGQKLGVLKGHTKRVTDLVVVERGPAAEKGRLFITASDDHTIRLHRQSSENAFEHVHTFETDGAVTGLTLHPSHKYFASASGDTWSLYSLENLSKLADKRCPERIATVEFHPDGLILATGSATAAEGGSTVVRLWQVASLDNVATFDVSTSDSPVSALDFSENGYYLAAAAQVSRTAKVFDLRKLVVAGEIELGDDDQHVATVKFDYSGSYLAIAANQSVRVHANKSWAHLATLQTGVTSTISSLAWGPDAQFLLAAGVKDRKLHSIEAADTTNGAQ